MSKKMIWELISIVLGGGLGALSRFGLSKAVTSILNLSAPWPTFVANMLGCLLFGLLFQLTEEEGWLSASYRPFLLTGFLGSLTTFSTFKHDNFVLLSAGDWVAAAANIILQVCLGLFFVWLGAKGAMVILGR